MHQIFNMLFAFGMDSLFLPGYFYQYVLCFMKMSYTHDNKENLLKR